MLRASVFGLDELISRLADGHAPLVALAVATLLGLRHASDPDHLVAVSTLVATEPDRPARRATRLGACWGAGHATTVLALGLPVVLAGSALPESLHTAAEALVGLVIVGLAARVLRRWRRGGFHAHPHRHGDVVHRHLHAHAPRPAGDAHGHAHRSPVRSPAQAFGIGLLHGTAGSAAVGVLLLASIGSRTTAAAALVLFALGTAVSMALLSSALGVGLARASARSGLRHVTPVLGALSLAFGAWYAAAALATVL